MQVRTIGIFEISDDGHHPRYLRWILESPLKDSFEFVIAGPTGLLTHSEMTECRTPFQSIPIVVNDQEKKLMKDFSFLGLARREFVVRQIYQRVFQQTQSDIPYDVIMIPYVDDCLNAISIAGSPFGSVPFLAINMHTQFHFSKVGVFAPVPKGALLREKIFNRFLLLKTLATLLTIDPSLMEYAADSKDPELRKLNYLPDPGVSYHLPSQDQARTALNIPQGVKVVLAYGALTERKGVFSLLEAAAHPNCPSSIHVLLAGKQGNDVAQFLEGPVGTKLREQGRLHVWPGYVPSEMESTLLVASNCMWVGYNGFHFMSSILVMAGMNGLPSITSEQGVVGYLERKHSLGIAVDPSSIPSTLAGLLKLHDSTFDAAGAAARGREAFASHTVDGFGNALQAAVMKAVAP